MEWDGFREKHKQLLLEWRDLRTKIDPLDKIVIGGALGPEKELTSIPNDVFDAWWKLKEKEFAIFNEINRLREEYYSQNK